MPEVWLRGIQEGALLVLREGLPGVGVFWMLFLEVLVLPLKGGYA